MRRLLILLAIILSLLGACTQEQAEYPTIEDEYAVYSAVLEYYRSNDETIIVISDKVELHEDFLVEEFSEIFLWKYVTQINLEGWEDYIVLEEKIISGLDIPGKEVVLLSNEELNEILEKAENRFGCFNLLELYPDAFGCTWLSTVAFHPDRKEAIVYLGWSAGPLSGRGYHYYLRYMFGEWRVIGVNLLWMS